MIEGIFLNLLRDIGVSGFPIGGTITIALRAQIGCLSRAFI